MVCKKNYPKRLNLRVWVQTDRPYTGEELSHYYAEWIQAGYVDGGLFQPNRRCYVQHPKLINTPCALEGAEWIHCYEGEPLKVSNLNSSYKKINSSNKTSKISNKKRDTDPKEVALMKETIKDSNREALPKLLEEWAETGVLDGNRNALFPWLFQREAFFYSGDTARLAMMLEERPAVLGDRQRWLKSVENGQKEERWLIEARRANMGSAKPLSKSFGLTKSTFQNVTGKNSRIFEAQQSKAGVALIKPRVSFTIWWNGQSELNNRL